ncbi:MAG TPA: MBL fold metallo-hydrolase [Acidimicrobiales bacterium]|nr:MBL fold metallo-hydrolase [Acidimicrobiales bacterium]
MVQVEIVRTQELGDRSYVAHDGQVAIVIDPQRDVERVEDVLRRLELECSFVVETHIHNDYVTGGYALARRTGAEYLVAAVDDVLFERRSVADGDEFHAGSMTLRVVATPGHTDGHLAFVVSGDDDAPVVFSGGSLLYGSVGRTDLVDGERTDELTRAQYRSVRRLAGQLEDPVALYPTHGFGSFCSSGTAAGGDESTIGIERARNDALVTNDEDDFVQRLMAGLTAYPSYYAHMRPLNIRGPHEVELASPTILSPVELAENITAGEWVVDLRPRADFAASHAAGTINMELGDNFSTYLGWLMPWGSPLTLMGESTDQIERARTHLARIGVDQSVNAVIGAIRTLTTSLSIRHYRRASFAELSREAPATVLDVRRDDEVAKGAIVGSTHIPLHALGTRLGELSNGPLWVHCASGFRASIAASLLDRSGRDVVLVDDDFSNARGLVHQSVN